MKGPYPYLVERLFPSDRQLSALVQILSAKIMDQCSRGISPIWLRHQQFLEHYLPLDLLNKSREIDQSDRVQYERFSVWTSHNNEIYDSSGIISL